MWSSADQVQLEQQLRELLVGGLDLQTAIRELHASTKLGALLLVPAVAFVARISTHEAKRAVVRALSPYLQE
jgi:hypothetical protein